jgi:hypothetical protein
MPITILHESKTYSIKIGWLWSTKLMLERFMTVRFYKFVEFNILQSRVRLISFFFCFEINRWISEELICWCNVFLHCSHNELQLIVNNCYFSISNVQNLWLHLITLSMYFLIIFYYNCVWIKKKTTQINS